jgi:deoxyhypusine synthase
VRKKSAYLSGKKIAPSPIAKDMSLVDLVDQTFLAYNGGRLREACQLFTRQMLKEDVTVGISITGALTPAGLGKSALIPMIQNGFVDWIVSTGANFYHDLHFGMGMDLHSGSPFVDDTKLKKENVIRIYDILFDFDVLLHTDDWIYKIIAGPEFQKEMATSELHNLLGKYVHEVEKQLGIGTNSILSAAYQAGVPCYTSSPGDSSIGMNIAGKALEGNKLKIDVSLDVNETTAIVYDAKKDKRKSGVVIFGGGSPKNFVLQTEPQIQEVLMMKEKGHDYYIQFTDARPDTGGLSGATPSEAVSWGKIDPSKLQDTIVCYTDNTIAMPILIAYGLAKHDPRPLKRLYDRRGNLLDRLKKDYLEVSRRVSGLRDKGNELLSDARKE